MYNTYTEKFFSTKNLTIFKGIYGSRLYCMDGPSSDHDSVGIYLPPISDCILGNVKDSIKTEGIDDTMYSIQKFIRLAVEGQSVCMEMLFSPKEKTIIGSTIWDELVSNRERFLSKKMKNFCGFAKSQAIKYSARADRLNDIVSLQGFICNWSDSNSTQFLGCNPLDKKLSYIWDILPEGVNYKKSTNQFNRSKDNRVYIVCGRELQIHCTIEHVLEFINVLIGEYGARVKQASAQIIDWKSLSHAYRVSYQAKQLVQERTLTFPAKEVEFLRDVKFGKLGLIKDGLDVKLDDLINHVDRLMVESDLPDEVDWNWCEQFILRCYGK